MHHDHNLRSAYLHVLADALTSVLAILALLAGKFDGLFWLDPAMGVVGAILVARWSIGLVRDDQSCVAGSTRTGTRVRGHSLSGRDARATPRLRTCICGPWCRGNTA